MTVSGRRRQTISGRHQPQAVATVAGRNARARTSLSQHDGRRSRHAPARAPCTHASTALTPPRHRTQSISALLTAWTNGNGTTSASTGQPYWASTRDIAQRFSDWANDSTSNIRCSESIEYSGIVEALKQMYDEQRRSGTLLRGNSVSHAVVRAVHVLFGVVWRVR